MTHLYRRLRSPRSWTAALVVLMLCACGGGGMDPVLGAPAVGIRPTVSSTSPAASSPMPAGVSTSTDVSATFDQPMTAALVDAGFTLACPAAAAVPATVS